MSRRPLTHEEMEDARRLKQLWNQRKDQLHLSQAKAADELGYQSQAAVSQYLNGRVPLNMKAVAGFAKMLRIGVEEISPRFGKMVAKPIPSELDGFSAPQTGSINGVQTNLCLDWFAFSGAAFTALEAKSLKAVRLVDDSSKEFPAGSVFLVDDSYQGTATDGVYLLLQGDAIVVRRVTIDTDGVTIHGPKKMKLAKDAFGLLKILARVVAEIRKTV